ncbi:DUF2085 domain-containing protein [Bacillus dakarensis]|uniref:DUF2085 domain-containing protein n=1 Tax=Robertmurraya dakarensis TaxID=1926278 RepID=UPI00098268B1|nr:DUF2085 domain-containing protein [Bacillus dakarensis]
MLETLEHITFFLGKAICHQLPERTFMIDGHYLPICSRCAGIYIGIFSSLLYLFLKKRYVSSTIPSTKISLFLLLLLFPLMIDGFGSYLGIYTTNNLIRVITGFVFGTVLPFFVVPLLSHSFKEKFQTPVLTNMREFFIPLLASGVISILTYLSMLPFLLLNFLVIGTIIIWVTSLFFLFFKKIKNHYVSACLSLMSCILTLVILSHLHDWILPS